MNFKQKQYLKKIIKEEVEKLLTEKTVPFESTTQQKIGQYIRQLGDIFKKSMQSGEFDTTEFLDPLGDLTQHIMKLRNLRENLTDLTYENINKTVKKMKHFN